MPSPYPNNPHKILEGYPITKPFQSITEVNDYFNNDRIVCLLCGKQYKSITAGHLMMVHNITVDEYKEMYAIPNGRGLSCITTKEKHSNHAWKMVDKGKFVLNKKGCDMSEFSSKPKRKCPQKSSVARNNLNEHMKPKRDLVRLNGKLVTFTESRKIKRLKKGTPEYQEMLLARPQCQPDIVRRNMGSYWKGRKRSEETTRKRLETLKKIKASKEE